MTTIRQAQLNDREGIEGLLQQYDLRAEGVLADGSIYWITELEECRIVAVGLELGQRSVLLRSAVIEFGCRGRGLGAALAGHALEWARMSGYASAYCFSTEATGYWEARGFRQCKVEEVVKALPRAPQVCLFAELGWLESELALRIDLQE